MRRILAVCALTAVVAMASGCSGTSKNNASPGGSSSASAGATATATADTSAGPTAGTSAGPSASSMGNQSANAKEVCDAIDKAGGEETQKAIITQVTTLAIAVEANNKAGQDAAKAALKDAFAKWAKALRDIAPTAQDPALKTAITQTADKVASIGSEANLAKIKTSADMEKLGTDLAAVATPLEKFCT